MEEKKTPLRYRMIRWLVKRFSPHYTLVGEENLPDGPCVIVGNHCQMYGPIAAELYTPGAHYVWCAGEMMDRNTVAAYAYQDFWSFKPKRVRWFYRLLSHLITPLAVLIFNSAHTVPVYRDVRVVTTFRDSVKKLEAGCRLVIFPEKNERYNNILYAFQDRFFDLGRMYGRKTGQELVFVPMYLSPGLKTICFGLPEAYCGENRPEEERTRLCTAMMERITALACALPEHTVVPYRNIPKREYPKNRPVEEVPYEKTTC